MKRYAKIYKIIALVNSYHSLEGSDYAMNKDVCKAMEYCQSEVCKLTGVDNIHCLPTQMDDLIEYLNKTEIKL